MKMAEVFTIQEGGYGEDVEEASVNDHAGIAAAVETKLWLLLKQNGMPGDAEQLKKVSRTILDTLMTRWDIKPRTDAAYVASAQKEFGLK